MSVSLFGFDRKDGSCLACDDGHAIERIGRETGFHFYGCSNFPQCHNIGRIERQMFDVDPVLTDDDIADCYARAFYDGDG